MILFALSSNTTILINIEDKQMGTFKEYAIAALVGFLVATVYVLLR